MLIHFRSIIRSRELQIRLWTNNNCRSYVACVTKYVVTNNTYIVEIYVIAYDCGSSFAKNRSAIQIAYDNVFLEYPKHIKIECHFIWYHVFHSTFQLISTLLAEETVDVFTKTHPSGRPQVILSLRGMLETCLGDSVHFSWLVLIDCNWYFVTLDDHPIKPVNMFMYS